MPDCVSCSTLPPCDCSEDQICVLVGRSCDSCGENTCQDDPNKQSSGGGSGSGAGATAGGAVGGAIAALLLALAAWWFWRRRRRQQMHSSASSGRRSYRDNTHGNSSGLKVRFGEDAKAESSPAPRRSNRMSRSMAMGLEEKGLSSSDAAAASPQATPNAQAVVSPSSGGQSHIDPFSDQHSTILMDVDDNEESGNNNNSEKPSRSASQRSRRASARASQSAAAPMPAAYIPAHANSMSVTDGLERDSLGSRRQRKSQPENAPPQLRLSLSALPQTEAQVMAASPGLSTPGSSTPGGSTSKSKPKPARPTREGLDLRLPTPSSSANSTKSGSFGVSSPPASPGGFPWNAAGGSAHASGIEPPPPTTATNSRFSAATTSRNSYSTTDGRYSLAPPNAFRPHSAATSGHMSMASHMSYILNPPQIMTATSTGRVGVVGPAVARTVQLGSSAPNTPGAVESLQPSQEIPPLPTHAPQSRPLSNSLKSMKRDTVSSMASDDPFADEVSAVIGQFPNPLATPTFGSSAPNTPTATSQAQRQPSPLRHSSGDDSMAAHRSIRANTPTSMVFSVGDGSARNSLASDGTLNSRPNTMFSNVGRPVSKDSLMDSMPFKAPPLPPSSAGGAFVADAAGPIASAPNSSAPGAASKRQTHATLHDLAADDLTSPLPEPSRPYAAGQGSSNAERHSNASSLGALENIPFNLGFAGNDRASIWSEASDRTGLRDSHFSTASDAPQVPAVDLSRHSLGVASHRSDGTLNSSYLRQGSHLSSPQVGQDLTLSDKEEAERLRTPAPNSSFQQQQQQQQQPQQQESQEHSDQQDQKPATAMPVQASAHVAVPAPDGRASVDSFMASALLAQQFEDGA